MEKLTNIWAELEKRKKLPSGTLTESCQSELQELMRQLDIMLSSKKREWERQMDGLQEKIDMRDQELRLNTSTLHLKTKENEDLHGQMMVMNKVQKEIVQEYEGQLNDLRSEVEKMKKEYEKLQRKYTKQSKDSRRMKEDVLCEISGSKTEINKLKDQLEEHQHQSMEWEQQKRNLQKELENLQSQNRALEEKYDFIQQQSETYKSQLGRRRQLQGDTESTLNAKISHLEELLQRRNETISQQKEKITSLKRSLNEALSAHKQAMTDNETLIEDVKKLNLRLRTAESDKGQLESELESRDHLMWSAQDDAQQCYHRLASMEQTLAAKDEVIRSLGDSSKQEVSEKITILQESLQKASNEIRDLRRREKQLKDEVAIIENKFKMASKSSADVSSQLHEKDEELHHVKNTQVNQLTQEVQKLVDKMSTMEESHMAQLDGMKVNLSELTAALHQRDSTILKLSEHASQTEAALHQRDSTILKLSERASKTEERIRELCTQIENKLAELKVTKTQIESLRIENRHLRHDVVDKLGTVFDRVEAERRLQVINDDYLNKITTLQQENRELREDLARLQHEMSDQHRGYQDKLETSEVNSALTLQSLQANNQRQRDAAEIATDHQFSTMHDYMDSTVRRHDDQLHVLESQKHRLQDELQMEKHENERLTNMVHDKNADTSAQSESFNDNTNHESEAMSLLHSFDDLDSPRLSDFHCFNSNAIAEAAADRFLLGERERLKDLETLIDSRIEDMKTNMDTIITKYHHR